MEATAWLGHWYREVAQNYAKARNCYKKVLAADPTNTVIGARPHHPSHQLPSLVCGILKYCMQYAQAATCELECLCWMNPRFGLVVCCAATCA